MASAVCVQFNPKIKPFVPTVMAPKLAYRRGKREGGEELVSKHQIRSVDGRWAGRRDVGRLNPRRETKIKGKNRDRERDMKEKVTNRRAARQSRAALLVTEQKEGSSMCAWMGDHSCHA